MAMDLRGLQVLCSLPLGEAQVLAGCLEEAHTLAERALALPREHQERGYEAYALRLLGEIVARQDASAVEQAKVHYQEALILAAKLVMRPLQAHCHCGFGALAFKEGQLQPAPAVLTTAIILYRTMSMTFWLPQIEAALEQVEG